MIEIPLRVVSEANQREHWRTRNRRKVAQQKEVNAEWKRQMKNQYVNLPCVVTFTRIGPKALDSDNLAGSFKAVRDEVARLIGVDDGSERIKFDYQQRAIGKREYGILIEVVEVSGKAC